MRAPITLLDRNMKATNDYDQSMPFVVVNLDLDYKPVKGEPAPKPQFQRVHAVVDTGTNVTTVSNRLIGDRPPEYSVGSNDMRGESQANVHRALILIEGFGTAHRMQIVCGQLGPVDMLIGRDLLLYYRMVYDTPAGIFYLEEPRTMHAIGTPPPSPTSNLRT